MNGEEYKNPHPTERSLSIIARDVRDDWKRVNYAAEPYLSAMETMDKIDEDYGADTGASIVLYFLSNAATWRGETARRIKAELQGMADRVIKGRYGA